MAKAHYRSKCQSGTATGGKCRNWSSRTGDGILCESHALNGAVTPINVPAAPKYEVAPLTADRGKDAEQWMRALEIIAAGGTLQKACDAAGMHRRTIVRRRQNDPDFEAEFQSAWQAGTDYWIGLLQEVGAAGNTNAILAILRARDSAWREVKDPAVTIITGELHAQVDKGDSADHIGNIERLLRRLEDRASYMKELPSVTDAEVVEP